MSMRGQGSIEYLAIIVVALGLIATLAYFSLSSTQQVSKSGEISLCRQAAMECYAMKKANPDYVCDACARVCVDREGNDILGTAGAGYGFLAAGGESTIDIAVTNCRAGAYSMIYEDSATVCGDGLCTGAENAGNCPQDCGGEFGFSICNNNWHCDDGEDAITCPYDCGGATGECNDGIDNDNDGLTDKDDPDCRYSSGESESGPEKDAPPQKKVAVCGNGILEPGEQCDDGNTDDGDGCSSECLTEKRDEIAALFDYGCDGANCEFDGSASSSSAGGIASYCWEMDWGGGYGVCHEGATIETVFPGPGSYSARLEVHDVAGNSASATKYIDVSASCGNGILEGDEECDDGNWEDWDGCSSDCRKQDLPKCGDGIINQDWEECESGDMGVYSWQIGEYSCRTFGYDMLGALTCTDGCRISTEKCFTSDECTLHTGLQACVKDWENGCNWCAADGSCKHDAKPCCGNWRLDFGESCDDGNNVGGDGCSATCQVESGSSYCGNGILEGDEVCDGTDLGGWSCTNLPSGTSFTGGGTLKCAAQKSAGRKTICYLDVSGCHDAVCGDGVKEGDEECDDGNKISGDGCSSECKAEYPPKCGDGVANGREACDGTDMGGLTCANFGFKTGKLGCTADCRPDLSGCVGGCGNGACEAYESKLSCPQDCEAPFCGNLICEYGAGEHIGSCPKDCISAICGDAICSEGFEDQSSCCEDCGCPSGESCVEGKCEETSAICGDGILEMMMEDGINKGEECDDGNNIDGDGCSSECMKEGPEILHMSSGPMADHSCVIMGDRTMKCWGSNEYGQLGSGSSNRPQIGAQDVVTKYSPIEGKSELLQGVIDTAQGAEHTCAVAPVPSNPSRYGVYCWGRSQYGQAANGVKKEAWAFKPGDWEQILSPDGSYSQVTAGEYFTCAISESDMSKPGDERVVCWGRNDQSQCSGTAAETSGAGKHVSSGASIWSPSSGIVKISAGKDFVIALLGNGKVCGWGANDNGQLGIGYTGDQTEPICSHSDTFGGKYAIDIAAGGYHACALVADGPNDPSGDVWCWGKNDRGQTGALPAWTKQMATPRDITYDHTTGRESIKLTGIAAGEEHSCGISSDGGTLCWGDGFYGQLGWGSVVGESPSLSNSLCMSILRKINKNDRDKIRTEKDLRIYAFTAAISDTYIITVSSTRVSTGSKNTCFLKKGERLIREDAYYKNLNSIKCVGNNQHGQAGDIENYGISDKLEVFTSNSMGYTVRGINQKYAPVCGNGVVEGDEECDDGDDPIINDGCFRCRKTPSVPLTVGAVKFTDKNGKALAELEYGMPVNIEVDIRYDPSKNPGNAHSVAKVTLVENLVDHDGRAIWLTGGTESSEMANEFAGFFKGEHVFSIGNTAKTETVPASWIVAPIWESTAIAPNHILAKARMCAIIEMGSELETDDEAQTTSLADSEGYAQCFEIPPFKDSGGFSIEDTFGFPNYATTPEEEGNILASIHKSVTENCGPTAPGAAPLRGVFLTLHFSGTITGFGGHCQCMARAVAEYYNKPSLKPEKAETLEMKLSNDDLYQDINRWCTAQTATLFATGLPILRGFWEEKHFKNSGLYNAVKASQNRGNIMMFVPMHAMNAFGYYDVSDAEKNILVYDNNQPYNTNIYRIWLGSGRSEWIYQRGKITSSQTYLIPADDSDYLTGEFYASTNAVPMHYAQCPLPYLRDALGAITDAGYNIIVQDGYSLGDAGADIWETVQPRSRVDNLGAAWGVRSKQFQYVTIKSMKGSFRSPVNVRIIDAFGREMSADTKEIPGANFEVIDGETYFDMPDGQEYTVYFEGYGHGEMALDFSRNAGESNHANINKIDRIAITPKTRGEYKVTPGKDTFTVKIDDDGDGTVDREMVAGFEGSVHKKHVPFETELRDSRGRRLGSFVSEIPYAYLNEVGNAKVFVVPAGEKYVADIKPHLKGKASFYIFTKTNSMNVTYIENISLDGDSSATLSISEDGTHMTMEVDEDGDGDTDETHTSKTEHYETNVSEEDVAEAKASMEAWEEERQRQEDERKNITAAPEEKGEGKGTAEIASGEGISTAEFLKYSMAVNLVLALLIAAYFIVEGRSRKEKQYPISGGYETNKLRDFLERDA